MKETVYVALEQMTLVMRDSFQHDFTSRLECRKYDGSACLLLVVHGVHSGSSLIVGGEADETETAAAAGITVLDDGLEREMGVLEGCDQL